MTYSVGGLIEASDYNNFLNTLNTFWGTGSTDSGWGQTALTSVTANTVVTATNWATLVNTIKSAGSQTNTTLTSRTAPVTGNVIAILANVGVDINSCSTNRGNTPATGTTSSTWTGATAKTTGTGSGTAAWTITWTQTVTFPSADQARYFWNAGGTVTLFMSKTSTGTDIDPDWNTFINTVGNFTMSGRVNNANQAIGSLTATGFTRSGGSGTPSTLLSTTGWYTLTAGAAASTMFQLNSTVYPYTSDFVRITAAKNAASTVLTLVTTWSQSAQSYSTVISGGTDTASPFTAFGTAPAVLCRYGPPATTYLTNSWGTPTIASSVA